MENIFEKTSLNNILIDVLDIKKVFEDELSSNEYNSFNFNFFDDEPIYDCSFEKYVDKYNFRSWKFRGNSITVKSFKKKIGIESINESSTFEELINYLEYVYNMLLLFDKKNFYDKETYNALIKSIKNILSQNNLKIEKIDTKKYIIINDNIALEKLKKTVEPSIYLLLVNYLNVKSKLSDKKKILFSLAKYFEGEKEHYSKLALKNQYTNKLYDDNSYFFNNYHIRHNNKKGSKIQPEILKMNDKDLEEIYDHIYLNCIILLLLKENDSFYLKTKELKKIIFSK